MYTPMYKNGVSSAAIITLKINPAANDFQEYYKFSFDVDLKEVFPDAEECPTRSYFNHFQINLEAFLSFSASNIHIPYKLFKNLRILKSL